MQIEQIGATGATLQDNFDGTRVTQMFNLRNVLPVGTSAQWDMTITVATGDDPGPFDIRSVAGATSPSRDSIDSTTATVSQAVPIIGIVEREFTSENNNDGTYSIEHVLGVENAGGVDLAEVNVSTDLENLFDGLILGEVENITNCTSTVRIGESCTTTQQATIRPGSASGPYEVATLISAADDDGLIALVVPESDEASDVQPVVFDEAPSIELEAGFSDSRTWATVHTGSPTTSAS